MERTIEFDQVGGNMMVEYEELLDRTDCDNSDTVIPAVGRKVYVLSVDSKCIYEEEVYALGRESFLVKGFRNYKEHFGEFLYEAYFERWFLDVADAKKRLERYLNEDEILDDEGVDGVWWVTPF